MTDRITGFSCAALLHAAIFAAVGIHCRHSASLPVLPPQAVTEPLTLSFRAATGNSVAEAPESSLPEEPPPAEVSQSPVSFEKAAAETPPPSSFTPLEMPAPRFDAVADNPAPDRTTVQELGAAAAPTAPQALSGAKTGGSLSGPEDIAVPEMFGNSEVSVSAPAAALKGIRPAYPYASRRRGEEGTVKLRIKVSPSGVAETVEIAESSGYRALDQAAVAAALQAIYLPAADRGQPRQDTIILPVSFRLTGQRR